MQRTYDIVGVFADESAELFKVRADNYQVAEDYVRRHYGATIAHWTGYATY